MRQKGRERVCLFVESDRYLHTMLASTKRLFDSDLISGLKSPPNAVMTTLSLVWVQVPLFVVDRLPIWQKTIQGEKVNDITPHHQLNVSTADRMRMVRWCIWLMATHLTIVCEVIRYRLVKVQQNLKRKKKTVRVGGLQTPSLSLPFSFYSLSYFLPFSKQKSQQMLVFTQITILLILITVILFFSAPMVKQFNPCLSTGGKRREALKLSMPNHPHNIARKRLHKRKERKLRKRQYLRKTIAPWREFDCHLCCFAQLQETGVACDPWLANPCLETPKVKRHLLLAFGDRPRTSNPCQQLPSVGASALWLHFVLSLFCPASFLLFNCSLPIFYSLCCFFVELSSCEKNFLKFL